MLMSAVANHSRSDGSRAFRSCTAGSAAPECLAGLFKECQNSMGDSALRLSVVSRNPISSELPRAKKGSAGSSLCSICDHMVPTALCCERESRSRLTAALSTHGFRL